MVLLDEHLWDLFKAGKISKESMLLKCQEPKEIQRKIDFDELGGAAPPAAGGPTPPGPQGPPAQPPVGGQPQAPGRPSSIFQRKSPQ
jgi:hypothetical protein